MSGSFSLEGKTAVVTGGSRGIGLAIARAYVDAGARVIISARGEEGLRAAVGQLGANALYATCDVADPASIAAFAQFAWGLGPVNVLVNNAGISPYYRRAEHISVEDWDSVVDVNLRGSYFCAVEFAKRSFEAGVPLNIVNVSSMTATVPLERLGVYCITKAGLDQMTRVLALEWADRAVRVNAISPGWVETDFTNELFSSRHAEKLLADVPLGRLAKVEDIVGAAVWLASDASAYATGTIVTLDGGRSLR